MLVALLTTVILLLLLVKDANGNFVYWANQSPGSTVGRAKINGTGLNDNFITGLGSPTGVAVDSSSSTGPMATPTESAARTSTAPASA